MGRPKGSRDKKPRSAETRANMSAAKRGELNPGWRGRAVSYRAAHSRVERARGKATEYTCRCGAQAAEWANLTGAFADLNDYVPMCCHCHRLYDWAKRKAAR